LQASIVALATDTARPRERNSADIRALFERVSIPPDVVREIKHAYAKLTKTTGITPPVAVRSTATAEDLPGASFAGQHDSFLNIRGESALLDAVKRCWSSLWTARALEYRARQGIEPSGVWMAVIVQQMVEAESSGVLFTANPLTGARDEIVLSASWGLGESIVGGSVAPDHVVVDKVTDAIREIKIGNKAVMTTLSDTGTAESPVDESKRRALVLNTAQVTELVTLGRAIEALYGSPQDIEWCQANKKIYIVQARPMTALPPAPVPWSSPVSGAKWMKDVLRRDGQRPRRGVHVPTHSQTSKALVRAHQRMAVSACRPRCVVADRLHARHLFVFSAPTTEWARARQAPLDKSPPSAERT